jgi:uncharacterized protein YgbK (DUF1537 family)
MSAKPKIIVLDDDPTGSQTVHSCLLLMQWDVNTLQQGLQDESPIFFILTNTRARSPEEAEQVTREVCQNLKQAIAQEEVEDFLVVSRSDSTLRGHYPVETDAIAEALGPFDAHFLIPAFFEGGRVTRDSTHYLMVNGQPVPTHETEFAKDSVFGYSTAYLPDYVEEKTKGRIPANTVERFTLSDIRGGSLERLMALQNNVCCAVDGETQADLNQFAQDVLTRSFPGQAIFVSQCCQHSHCSRGFAPPAGRRRPYAHLRTRGQTWGNHRWVSCSKNDPAAPSSTAATRHYRH